VFDLYPRHSHRTPAQIAEDTSGSFEPARPSRRRDEADPKNGSPREAAPRQSNEAEITSEPSTRESR